MLKAEAAERLQLPVEHDKVELLATLRLAHENLQTRLFAGEGRGIAAEISEVSDAIARLTPPEKLNITLCHLVRCPHCKQPLTANVDPLAPDVVVVNRPGETIVQGMRREAATRTIEGEAVKAPAEPKTLPAPAWPGKGRWDWYPPETATARSGVNQFTGVDQLPPEAGGAGAPPEAASNVDSNRHLPTPESKPLNPSMDAFNQSRSVQQHGAPDGGQSRGTMHNGNGAALWWSSGAHSNASSFRCRPSSYPLDREK